MTVHDWNIGRVSTIIVKLDVYGVIVSEVACVELKLLLEGVSEKHGAADGSLIFVSRYLE
jgi:hypothetical protein